MAARRTHYRALLLAAALVVSAAARAETQHANLLISVTVVRSCSVAAPDRVGQPISAAEADLLAVRCGRGGADAVALGTGHDSVVVHRGDAGNLETGIPIATHTRSGPSASPGLTHLAKDERTLVVTVNF